MRRLWIELRLYAHVVLLEWAMDVMPKDHPETVLFCQWIVSYGEAAGRAAKGKTSPLTT